MRQKINIIFGMHQVHNTDVASVLVMNVQLFNGLFSRTIWVSRYHKGKISLDLNEASDDGVLG